MKYTNNYKLPKAVFNALKRDEYDKGESDYSVTELISPPQQVQLKRRYWDELEEDVMDNVWSILGRAAHHVLENHASEESLSEKRLYVEVMGKKLGGQVDVYHDGVITDYKVTSAWTLVYGSRIDEWEEQLNLYAYIFRKNGYEVNRLQIVTILRDWQQSKAKQDRNYPQTPIVIIPLTLWSEETQHREVCVYMGNQLACEKLPDESLFTCSSEDMWEQPTKYALMKEGRKTAVRVVETDEDCDELSNIYDIDGRDYWWEVRPGTRTRCERYCPVSKYCHQYQEYLNAKKADEKE